jgi:tetratricopeptide (TPR) repeat protein
MWRRLLLFLPLLLTVPAPAKVENWIEVRSPHFIVATNSNEKQARRVADQFERMRSVFHTLFPKLNMDPGAPIVVLAVNGDKDFRALEPEAYLAKGSLRLGGLFLRAPDKNYVLMQLDAEGEHPYAVVYHEYTHLLLGKIGDWLPLWLNEGLAEFYQNTDIHQKDVALGQPSFEDIRLLRESPLLPLKTLFAVDATSPYYHEENKGSIFYAESWALTHFIETSDAKEKTNRLAAYLELLAKKTEPLEAATQAFGDLKKLEGALYNYVQRGSYGYFLMKTTTEVDESAFQTHPMTEPQADALRADFLAYNERIKDSRELLDHVLQQDPKNVEAHETMGYLEFRQGHLEEAKKWYAQAVQLDSQSYLAHYYYAAMAMQGSMDADEQTRAESSLRKSIQLNPTFAPSFDRLAALLGSHRKNLEEAHMFGLTAVSLDPSNVGYRVNVANVLLQMEQGKRAVEVLQTAAKLAKNPQEVQWVDNALMHAQEYAAEQERFAEQKKRMEAEARVSDTETINGPADANVPQLKHRNFVPNGPHHFLTGVLKDVHCTSGGLDVTLQAGNRSKLFFSEDYYKLPFSALGFQPSAELNPCKDLEGRPAKVEYVESADKGESARLVSVELHK